MGSRLSLQTLLQNLIGVRPDGKANVYFQPPESVKMNYPCIVYARDRIDNSHANDTVYKQAIRYSVTVVDSDPDSEIVTKVSKLPTTYYDRGFKADNLNHDVFKLYY